MTIQLKVTHPGGAHKDDFLACSLLAHLHGVPIQRRDLTDEDLANPAICGGAHQPEFNNFDHHHFPRDAPPLCALSLVLQSMGLYENALAFCAWLRPTEWLDTLGPNKASQLMGIPREALGEFNSPVDTTVLNRFANCWEPDPSKPICQVMPMADEDKPFEGQEIWDVMLSLGLRWGDMDCFHWKNTDGAGDDYYFSVETSTPPGYFLPEQIAAGQLQTADLIFVFSIPRTCQPTEVAKRMQKAVQYCQKRLGGTIHYTLGEDKLAMPAIVERISQIESELKELGFDPGTDPALQMF